MPAESTVYRWLKRSREAEVLRQTLQRVDLEREFQEFVQEKYTRARARVEKCELSFSFRYSAHYPGRGEFTRYP